MSGAASEPGLRVLGPKMAAARVVPIKIYDNTSKTSLGGKCSKDIFIAVKICSANYIFCRCWIGTSLGWKQIWAHKTKFWYLLGVFSKFSDGHPRHFHRGVPLSLSPPPPSPSRVRVNQRSGVEPNVNGAFTWMLMLGNICTLISCNTFTQWDRTVAE